MDKYPYYAKLAESNPTWQNAIRHNLSTVPEFVMVGDKNQIIRGHGGRGRLWTIKPGVGEKRLARLFREEIS